MRMKIRLIIALGVMLSASVAASTFDLDVDDDGETAAWGNKNHGDVAETFSVSRGAEYALQTRAVDPDRRAGLCRR